MKNYEITFISKTEGDPGVEKIIESLGGSVSSFHDLGRKNLAYPINKETAGFYFAVRFNLDPNNQDQLNKKLNLVGGIIRFLIVNLPVNRIAQQAEMLEKINKIKKSKGLTVAPAPEEPKELDKKERTKMVDAQLDKLLGKE